MRVCSKFSIGQLKEGLQAESVQEGHSERTNWLRKEKEELNIEDKRRRISRQAPRTPASSGDGTESMSTTLVSELERLASELDRDDSSLKDVSLEMLAGKIAKELRVKNDEVAILGVSNRWRHLHFLVPPALKNVGFIPLTSNSALAAKTVRESRPEINNEFAKVRHATVFEGVKAATTTGESIQKIISAPILCDGKVVGVMQVSRKAENVASAGADFSSDDLGKVLALCRPLGKLVRHLAGE